MGLLARDNLTVLFMSFIITILLLFLFKNEKPKDFFDYQLANIDPKIFRNIQKYRKNF